LLASTKDEKFKASVAEFGGARRLFEDVASQLGRSDSADEILGSLDDVRKKVAAHGQEQFSSLACRQPNFGSLPRHTTLASQWPREA